MLRLALILSVFYLVAQVYGRHPPVGLLKRYYDMVLHERGKGSARNEVRVMKVRGHRHLFLSIRRPTINVYLREEVDKCMGFPESFLDCAIIQGCENEACPKNMYCCSTDKCGNMCLCKRDPEGCNLFCHDGYILGANGCPECACRKKSQNEDIRRRRYYGRQVRRGYYGRQARREEKELESRLKGRFGK